MKQALLINGSHPHYNLGIAKLENWLVRQGWSVMVLGKMASLFVEQFDLICLSAIFSWDVPNLAEIAWIAKAAGKEVWAGGPGLFKMAGWWKERTGCDATIGIDWRFERERGSYRMGFAARGCPENCYFCIVTPMEGKEFTLDWDFQPTPILCDNNLSALPEGFQNHVIARYFVTGTRLIDANSGFEPRTFTEETYYRWKPILRGAWRFGFDYLPEVGNVRRMMNVLRFESAKKKQAYCMIGNEPIETCYERCLKVIEWGGEPYCQPMLELNVLDRKQYTLRYDWTPEKLTHFARFFNKHLWRGPNGQVRKLSEYRLGNIAPFKESSGEQQGA